MNVDDVYIELNDRPKIQLKPTPTSMGGGTPISNGTVVTIVQPTTIDNGHVLVSVSEQRGYIQIKYLKVAMNVLNGTPVMSMAYIPPVEVKADVPLLAPPQRQQQQYAPPPSPVQSDAPPSYNHVMENLEKYPVTYQDPITRRFYAVKNGNSYWLNGGSRRRKQRSSKKRLQKSRSKSRTRSKRLRK